ncbi:integrase [Gossypium australe]|uniref:Integrase n=1 Tax=Gossypium australe TaxID=47621 RepID=A0A5B6VPF7_9ROSI|nr:integrase [Gossypium australe]
MYLNLVSLFWWLEWKWGRIIMDFVSGFPLNASNKNLVWVIVDKLTKSAHFVALRTNYLLEKLVEQYIAKKVCMHSIPYSVVSDHDSRFTSRFWKQLQTSIETKFRFNITFHPETHR